MLNSDDAHVNLHECTHSRPCTCESTTTSESIHGKRQISGLTALADAAAMFSEKAHLTSRNLDDPSGSCCTKKPITHARTSQNFDLPPILSATSGLPSQVPDFRVMPPLAAIKSIAGSGCCCGLHCACPGCTEHRPPTHVATDRRDCKDGCGDCVDHGSGVALPGLDQGSSMVDVFFGSAKSHPHSLAHGRGPRTIDSTDGAALQTKDSIGEKGGTR